MRRLRRRLPPEPVRYSRSAPPSKLRARVSLASRQGLWRRPCEFGQAESGGVAEALSAGGGGFLLIRVQGNKGGRASTDSFACLLHVHLHSGERPAGECESGRPKSVKVPLGRRSM